MSMSALEEQRKKVSVIIPTRNRRADVIRCVASVYESEFKDMEVVVVDNGSSDGTLEALQEKFGGRDDFILEGAGRNLGAGGGRNLGAKLSNSELFLFVDDDNVVHPRMIPLLVEFWDKSDDCILVGPLMFFYKNQDIIWSATSRIDMLTSRAVHTGTGEQNTGQYSGALETGHLPNCFMTSADAFQVVGGFVEEYVVMYEEADFAYTLKKKFMKKAYVVCDAHIYHDVKLYKKQSEEKRPVFTPVSKERAFFIARNRVYFMRRHASLKQLALFCLVFFPASLLVYEYYILRDREFAMAWKYFQGAIAGFFLRIKDK